MKGKSSSSSLRILLPFLGSVCLLAWWSAPLAAEEDTPSLPPWAVVHTDKGAFVIQLFEAQVPKAVKHFIDLATGSKPWKDPKTGQMQQNRLFYDGLTIHRVLPTYLIQMGCPLGTGKGDPGVTAQDEFHPSLKHEKQGMVGFASAGPNTNGSQFYITQRAMPWLDARELPGTFCSGFETLVSCKTDQDCQRYAKLFPRSAQENNVCAARSTKQGYTIFGQVAHGMDVVNTISEAPVSPSGQPTPPIYIKRLRIQRSKTFKRSWLSTSED